MDNVPKRPEATLLWVRGLLSLLLYLGYGARKDQEWQPYVFYLLPVLVLFTFKGAASLPDLTLTWTGFLIGYGLGAIGFFSLQSRRIKGRNATAIQLSGAWLILTVLTIMFGASFVAGTVAVINPITFASPFLIGILALVTGSASGGVLGGRRALSDTSGEVGPSMANNPANDQFNRRSLK